MAPRIAFLRAINLGSRRRFAPQEIVAATEAAGFAGVATHINTGNVRFETRLRSRARIEEALEAAYLADRGFAVPTVVLTCEEILAVVADAEEIGAGHPGQHAISFLKQEPEDTARAALEARTTGVGRAHVRGRAVHLLLGETVQGSGLDNAVVERHLGVATARTLTVVRAIAAKWC